jgi:signal transduction histidine kinase/ActR/RegA family two-component response regulator
MEFTAGNEERLLILAPTGRDSFLIRDTLIKSGIQASICEDIGDLSLQLKTGAGVCLVAEEALHSDDVESLVAELKNQPAWSDVPLLLLSGAGSSLGPACARLMETFGETANITILERPLRVSTLLSIVRCSLRARRRQYEVRDYIAERRRIEEDLRQTQKLESIGVLAGGVAHDFNNLLVGIMGNASLALEMVPADNPAYPLLGDVVLAGQRAADLTRQLLAYSGRGRFVIQPINLSDLVKEISGLIQPSIPKKVRLRLDLDRNLPLIEGDSSQLQQLVMNLVINGAEATGRGETGAVWVTTGVRVVKEDADPHPIPPTQIPPGRYVCLEVQDDGTGMGPQTMSKIFDPFFTTKFTGRGLGLAAALGIVRGHQGGIEVESTPGHGALFRVYLPIADGVPREQPRASGQEDLVGTGTILFVDDEEMVREVARTCLQRYGYDVLLAEDGLEGVELFRKALSQISLVVLDMTMPVMSGEEALREMQKIRPDVKIILSSGYSEAEAVQRFTGKGLAGFIQKPYTATQLAQSVKAVLARTQIAA